MTTKPKKFRTKAITKAKLLFITVIGAAILTFIYAIFSVFTTLPMWPALIPFSIILIYAIAVFIWKNWKMIWIFIQNPERGRLLMLLNNTTHWDYAHKMKVIEWVYLRKNSVRNERRLKLGNKLQSGEELTKLEKQDLRKNVVACPQQILDGFNKTMLIDKLIYAHERIQVLDDELREILELTDENMMNFNYYAEIAKIKEPCLN